MTIITRIYFHWYEIEAILAFEKDNPDYTKIVEDAYGVVYELPAGQSIYTRATNDEVPEP